MGGYVVLAPHKTKFAADIYKKEAYLSKYNLVLLNFYGPMKQRWTYIWKKFKM